MKLAKVIGDHIKEYRLANDMAQLALAVEIDIEQCNVCCWEIGKTVPTIEHLKRVADFFGIKLWEFLQEVDL